MQPGGRYSWRSYSVGSPSSSRTADAWPQNRALWWTDSIIPFSSMTNVDRLGHANLIPSSLLSASAP